MSNWGVMSLRIVDKLEQLGPMTASEIAKELAVARESLGSIITRLKQPSKRPLGPKRIHIADWRDEEDGQRTYLRAVYGAGNKKSAPKPDRKSDAERSKRYRDNKRQQSFNLFNATL